MKKLIVAEHPVDTDALNQLNKQLKWPHGSYVYNSSKFDYLVLEPKRKVDSFGVFKKLVFSIREVGEVKDEAVSHKQYKCVFKGTTFFIFFDEEGAGVITFKPWNTYHNTGKILARRLTAAPTLSEQKTGGLDALRKKIERLSNEVQALKKKSAAEYESNNHSEKHAKLLDKLRDKQDELTKARLALSKANAAETAGWFEDLDSRQQKSYIKTHPNSKYAKNAKKAEKKEAPKRAAPGKAKDAEKKEEVPEAPKLKLPKPNALNRLRKQHDDLTNKEAGNGLTPKEKGKLAQHKKVMQQVDDEVYRQVDPITPMLESMFPGAKMNRRTDNNSSHLEVNHPDAGEHPIYIVPNGNGKGLSAELYVGPKHGQKKHKTFDAPDAASLAEQLKEFYESKSKKA